MANERNFPHGYCTPSQVKFVHCTLNKLKLTFVRCTTLDTSRACARETEKALCFSWLKFLFVSPFSGDFGQELFCKACHAFVISWTKGENWDGTDLRRGWEQGVQSTVNGQWRACLMGTRALHILYTGWHYLKLKNSTSVRNSCAYFNLKNSTKHEL